MIVVGPPRETATGYSCQSGLRNQSSKEAERIGVAQRKPSCDWHLAGVYWTNQAATLIICRKSMLVVLTLNGPWPPCGTRTSQGPLFCI